MAHTEQILRKLINRIAEQHGYENYEIILEETFSGGANYTSKLFTVIVREENKEDLHLFAKFAIIGKKFRNEVPMPIFETERYAYTKLFNVYRSLEEEVGLPEEHRLKFTKCYGFDPIEYQETVVMENLLAQGYGPFNRFKPLQWNYAESAIRELAKFHALSFALSEKRPKEFQEALKVFKFEGNEGKEEDEDFMKGMAKGSVESALKAVKPEYKAALEQFANKYMKNLLPRMYAPIGTTVIVHGDYRGNNLLHKVIEDGTIDIKIVDMQTLQGGSPVTDLLYFIFTGSDEQFRAQYYDKLIDHYYTQLSDAMKRLHLNPDEIFSRQDFDAELKEKLPFGLTLAVFTLPVITVDVENAPEVNETLEISNFSVENTSDLYTERLNGVVNDYVKWGILK